MDNEYTKIRYLLKRYRACLSQVCLISTIYAVNKHFTILFSYDFIILAVKSRNVKNEIEDYKNNAYRYGKRYFG